MAQLKMNEAGQPEFKDGKLILVLDDNSETEFDAVGVHSTFGAIRGERDTWEGKAKTYEKELTKIGKTEADRMKIIERARLAAQIDENKLIEAGKVDEVVAERLKQAEQGWHEKESTYAAEKAQLSSLVDEILIENAFARSKVLDDYYPTWSLLQHEFKGRLLRDGKSLIGFRDNEKKDRIYSASGKLAEGDELLLALLKSHGDHDKWKKGVGANGSDTSGNPKPNGGSGKTMTVDQFQALSPQGRSDFINVQGGTLT